MQLPSGCEVHFGSKIYFFFFSKLRSKPQNCKKELENHYLKYVSWPWCHTVSATIFAKKHTLLFPLSWEILKGSYIFRVIIWHFLNSKNMFTERNTQKSMCQSCRWYCSVERIWILDVLYVPLCVVLPYVLKRQLTAIHCSYETDSLRIRQVN